jgi:hypothetical protein
MKFNHSKAATKVAFFAAVVLIAGLFAGSVQAQSIYNGKFTLTHSVRWGQALLSAGTYRINIDPSNGSGMLMAEIFDTRTGQPAAMIACNIRENAKGPTVLILSRRGGEKVVHTLRVEELNESFIFDPSLAHRRVAEEAEATETVPILNAKK